MYTNNCIYFLNIPTHLNYLGTYYKNEILIKFFFFNELINFEIQNIPRNCTYLWYLLLENFV